VGVGLGDGVVLGRIFDVTVIVGREAMFPHAVVINTSTRHITYKVLRLVDMSKSPGCSTDLGCYPLRSLPNCHVVFLMRLYAG